ncbi:MAG: hypothetical protein M3220_20865 [Chloroflexota bacterium]|nr:hypothetical protein [Chloroflexota bacterium]
MQIDKRDWQPPDSGVALLAFELSHGNARMIVLPERGGKIVSLYHEPTQKEWLWLNPHLEWKDPSPSDSYVEYHDLGGWDECFPTIAATTVDGTTWPDHGDLWWRAWKAEIRDGALWMAVEGDAYRFERTIEGTETGFRFAYAVSNLSEANLPYLWSAHPLFCIDPPLTVEIFGRPRVLLGNDSTLGKPGDVHRWPRIQGRMFNHIGKPSELAAKLFIEMRRGEVTLCDQGGTTLQMRWPLRTIPMLGLWVNEGGWSGADVPPYFNLGVEPTTGAPDDLAVALTDWHSARILRPSERHEWWLGLTLGREES